MPGLLELEYESESHDAGLGIRIGIKNFGKMLVSESLAAGIRIGFGIKNFGKPWNQNHLQLES